MLAIPQQQKNELFFLIRPLQAPLDAGFEKSIEQGRNQRQNPIQAFDPSRRIPVGLFQKSHSISRHDGCEGQLDV